MMLWMIGLFKMLDGTPGMSGGGVGSALTAASVPSHRTAKSVPTSRNCMAMERPAAAPGSAPRPAASVLLLRPAEHDPFEVFMVRRAARPPWPHLRVFPGGTVHETDGGSSELAAVREVFEEAGILFARDAEGQPVGCNTASLATVREALGQRDFHFDEFLQTRGWRPDTDALVHFSHWITPLDEPYRFDTHFYIARSPLDQPAQADEIETHDGVWIAPREALLRFGTGDFAMIYPTIKHLERLLLFRNLDELFAFARTKAIETVMPTVYDGRIFAMNRDLEHRW
jgi:8-oxo-dGTP pyrophosphatase MutT (NUDIX family)